MLDYPALLALSEIIRRGSFEAAAHALSVTPSAISQRIRALEDRSGTVLIDRGPPVQGTEAGLRLAAHLDQVRLLEAALSEETQSSLPPVLRIAINADSLATWAVQPLAHAPGLVDLVIDDQDHAQEWLRNGQVVAALTSNRQPVTGCESILLGHMRYRATASPEFVRKHFPNGINLENLSKAPSLSFNSKDGLQEQWATQFIGQRVVLPLHRIPSSHAFAQATRHGLGWGLNPESMIVEDLAQRKLIDLAPEQPLDVPLYWQMSRIMAPGIAPLTHAMKRFSKSVLLP